MNVYILIFTALLFSIGIKRIVHRPNFFVLLMLGISMYFVNYLFFSSLEGAYKMGKDIYLVSTSDERYQAEVLGFEKHILNRKRSHRLRATYSPKVRFITQNGKIIERELEGYYTNDLETRDYEVCYHSGKDRVIPLGRIFFVRIVEIFSMTLIFTLLFIGVTRYCLGLSLARWRTWSIRIVLAYIFPMMLLMIAYHTYFVNYGRKMSTGAYVFISCLFGLLGIFVLYVLKTIIADFLFGKRKKKKKKSKKIKKPENDFIERY